MPRDRTLSWLKPGILVPISAAVIFASLALAVASGHDFEIDRRIVLAMRQPGSPSEPLGPPWFREAVRDLTAFGSMTGLGLVTIVAMLAFRFCRFRHLAIGLAVSVLGATAVSNVLKILIGRERPDIVEHVALTFTAGFPSGHAFISTVTYLCLAGFIGLASRRENVRRLCVWLAWIILILVGWSRLYLGVHWPTDVLGGWCLGVVWAALSVSWVARRMAKIDPQSAPART